MTWINVTERKPVYDKEVKVLLPGYEYPYIVNPKPGIYKSKYLKGRELNEEELKARDLGILYRSEWNDRWSSIEGELATHWMED